MKQVFPSRKGPEILIPVTLLLGTVTLLLLFSPAWPAGILLLLLDTGVLHLFLHTRYTLEGDELQIECGWLYRRRLPVKRILRIEETRNPLSSPALSLDRLALVLQSREYLLISPADKAGFIAAIRHLQPSLEVRYRRPAVA